MLSRVVQLLSQFTIFGGMVWLVWGIVTLAGGLKDHAGQQQQSGLWQIVGGGLIILAGNLFLQIQLPAGV